MIEVVSPGNKDSKHAIASFVDKAVDFLRNGIHFLVIDPFPPGPRDPDGIAQAIWDELVGEPLATRPADKPLTVAAFDAGEPLTAYVEIAGRRRSVAGCAPVPRPGLVRQRPARADLPGLVGRDARTDSRPRRNAGGRGAVTADRHSMGSRAACHRQGS